MRRVIRWEAVLAAAFLGLGVRAVGCKKKEAPARPSRPTPRIHSDFTPPPPRPTLTMPPGITRVPTLPE